MFYTEKIHLRKLALATLLPEAKIVYGTKTGVKIS